MSQTSPNKLNSIVGFDEIIISTQLIYQHVEKIRNAYEHLIVRNELLSKENAELKNRSLSVDFCAPNGYKRRKTEESTNDSIRSNDLLNEAIHELSSYSNVEDEIIESTPKPDVSKRNATKKITTFKSPKKRNEIKLKTIDDPKGDEAMDQQKKEVVKQPDSPLRSLENQSNNGKENRPKNFLKWIVNPFETPNRVSRSGFISPKSVSRLSLSKSSKQQSASDTKPAKETAANTCGETFFDGTPPKQISNVKGKFLRQQRLEAFLNSSKEGSDDENVFNFKSDLKSDTTSSTSPLKIKSEPLTGQMKKCTNVSPTKVAVGNTELPVSSGGSSVVAISGERDEVILIPESQPLFEDFSETFCDNMEINLQAVESIAKPQKMSENEKIVAKHLTSCRQCNLFISTNPHLTMPEKLGIVDNCKYSTRPDTDSEFWNPRFVDTPESQKQETLIDDRWTTRKRKS